MLDWIMNVFDTQHSSQPSSLLIFNKIYLHFSHGLHWTCELCKKWKTKVKSLFIDLEYFQSLIKKCFFVTDLLNACLFVCVKILPDSTHVWTFLTNITLRVSRFVLFYLKRKSWTYIQDKTCILREPLSYFFFFFRRYCLTIKKKMHSNCLQLITCERYLLFQCPKCIFLYN